MENNIGQIPANKWLSVPIIATITRLLCREVTLQNEYLQLENKILKSKINKRIVFTDDERRSLVESAMAMGRDLMEQVVTVVNGVVYRGIDEYRPQLRSSSTRRRISITANTKSF